MSDNYEKEFRLDFTTFVLSISSAAYMGLGDVSRPGSNTKEINLDMAKQNIQLLELMKDKTKNNLTSEEDKLINEILFELRMRFVEVQKNSSKESS